MTDTHLAACGVCKQPSVKDNGCVRCGHQLCMEHTPYGDGRCETCEDEFRHRFSGAKFQAMIAGLAAVGAIFGVLFLTGVLQKIMTVVSGIPYGAPGLMFLNFSGATGLAVWIARTMMRRRFLAERPDTLRDTRREAVARQQARAIW